MDKYAWSLTDLRSLTRLMIPKRVLLGKVRIISQVMLLYLVASNLHKRSLDNSRIVLITLNFY